VSDLAREVAFFSEGECLMPTAAPEILEALRLPELYRAVCVYAGVPMPPATAAGECFILRCGAEPPELFAELLEEAFVEDEAEVAVRRPDEPLDCDRLGVTPVAVEPGFAAPCPCADELRRAVGGGPVLLFAIERQGAAGRLLGRTWAAVPEEEPPQDTPFRAALARDDP
jgi:hypothetical protein